MGKDAACRNRDQGEGQSDDDNAPFDPKEWRRKYMRKYMRALRERKRQEKLKPQQPS